MEVSVSFRLVKNGGITLGDGKWIYRPSQGFNQRYEGGNGRTTVGIGSSPREGFGFSLGDSTSLGRYDG